ncbi:MAG: DUF433 domain-containing protein [Geminicoccaceae bacterium]
MEIDPAGLGGKSAVNGSRIMIEMLANGWADTRIVAEFPTLTPEDMRACLRYAAAMLHEERRFALPAA